MPLAVMMAIFFTRYAVAVTLAMHPALKPPRPGFAVGGQLRLRADERRVPRARAAHPRQRESH